MNKHLYWIDFAKVIGLYLMVLGHGNMVSDDLRCYIYSFHMPLFFVISGLFAKDYIERIPVIKGSFKTLMIPYICLNAVCLIFFSLLELYKGTFSIGLLKSQMFAIALGVGYATESLTPVCTPIWFFYALFIIKIVYAVVPKTKISKTLQFVLCFVAVRLLTYYNIDTYIPLDSAIMAYPFFLIGTESKQLLNSSCCRNYKKVSLTVIVLVLSYFISQFNGRCDIDTMRYGSYYSLFIFTGIATTISILTICKMIIEYVSYIKSQLTVLCIGAPLIVGLNLLIINVVKPIFSFLVGEWNSIYGMILGIIIMCLFYPLIIFTKRYMPIVLGNRKERERNED